MKYEALHNPQCIAERLFGTFLYIQYTHTQTKAKQCKVAQEEEEEEEDSEGRKQLQGET